MIRILFIIMANIIYAGWTAFFICNGLEGLHKILGGSALLYWLFPVIPAGLFSHNREVHKLTWSIMLTVIGLIAVNYMDFYYMNFLYDCPLLFKIYPVFLPPFFISLGFMTTTLSIVKTKAPFQLIEEDRIVLKNFEVFLVAVMCISCYGLLPFLFLEKSQYSKFLSGYSVVLITTVISSLYLLYEIRKVDVKTINYYARTFPRFIKEINIKPRYIYVIIIFFVIVSFGDEYSYRGNWTLWTETMLLFLTYVALLSRLSRILFQTVVTERPDRVYMPSGLSRKTIALLIIVFILSMLSVILS